MSLSSATSEIDDRDTSGPGGSVLRERALRAARRVIAERGLGVSMDDVAEAAGVNRRSLFRHFGTRDVMVAEAVSTSLDWYDQRVENFAGAELSLDEWLAALVAGIHTLHDAAGAGLWQLAAASAGELSPELAEVNDRRRQNRKAATERLAREAWRRAGGRGPCPQLVIDAFALTISSFVTRSMVHDAEVPLDRVVACTTALLSSLLRSRVAGGAGPRRRD